MKNNTPKKSRLVHGIGINDADYVVRPTINGTQVWCPFYQTWAHMLMRCYSSKGQTHRPSYIGCAVDSKWLVFSNFKSWMENQDWEGKSIDKDILIQNNKVYSPLTCIFVNNHINSLLNSCTSARGELPRGVSFDKRYRKYSAKCSAYGNYKNIGRYDTSEEAHQAYKEFKYKYIAEIANQQSEPLRTALLNYKIEG
jgi:hypothetical protein